MAEPHGSFSVSLQRIAWLQDAPDADDSSTSQSRSIWACVQLVQATGGASPMDAFWFTADEEQACTKAVELQPTHADDESDDVALGYIQGSKSIPTTFEAVNTLLSAQLLVTLYAGTTRLAASDECIGEQRVSLLPAVMSGQSRQQIHIPLSWDAQQRISLAVAVQCDAELVEFALGARVLQFQSLAIVNLPHDWTFECQTDEEAIRLCEAPDRNLACYEVEIELPAVTASEDGSNAEKFSFQGGKLTYEASVAAAVESEQEQQLPQEAEAESAGADGEGEDAANPTPKPCTGTWKVAFPNNQLPSKLYLKSAVDRLVEFLQVHKFVTGRLHRTATDSGSRLATDAVSVAIRVDLSALLSPGETMATCSGLLRKAAGVSKEAIEQELAAATSNDDKKRLQTMLNEYETLAQQTVALSRAMTAAGTQLTLQFVVLNSPLVLLPPESIVAPTRTLDELIPRRDLAEEAEAAKDSFGELRSEIRRIVLTLLHEYEETSLRPNSPSSNNDAEVARDEQKEKLIFRLNTQGTYHAFKETLKKRIIPVIRDRFMRPEASDDDADSAGKESDTSSSSNKIKEEFAQLYTMLMQEVHAILQETFYSDGSALEQAQAAAAGHDHAEVLQVLRTLELKALENEVNGDTDKCELMHLDCIAFAEKHAQLESAASSANCDALSAALVSAWYNYSRFCIALGRLEKAGAGLRQCLSLNPHAMSPVLTFAALLCEISDLPQAEDATKQAVLLVVEAELFNWANLVLAHALLAYYFVHSDRDATGNLTLFELLKAQKILQKHAPQGEQACLSSVWLFLAEKAHEWRLRSLPQRCLQLAQQFRKPRDTLSVHERVMKRVVEAEICLLSWESMDQSMKLLQDALEIDASHPLVWLVLGKAYLQRDSNQKETAIECLQRALTLKDALQVDRRLAVFVHLGLVLLQVSQFAAAEAVFLHACEEFRSMASNWLGMGIACFRMNKFESARMALAEANCLDGSNPEVWGYLALLALNSSASVTLREERDARRFVDQALRYNLSNPVLLRELSSGFVAIDRLEDAERLLRRSLVCQDSSLTRKTLADVLAAQNCAEDALREYKQSMESSTELRQRCDLLEKCAKLLITLGRPEDAAEYRSMASQFQIEEA